MNVSKLVEFRESERSPVGQQASSGRGIFGLATSVDFHVGSIDSVNKQISDSFLVDRHSVAAPLLCDHDHTSNVHFDKPAAKKRKRLHHTSSVPLPHQASPEKHSSLIETATYPGYSSHHTTPLPQGIDTTRHLQQVIDAQDDLKCKPSLREFWSEQLLSHCSQAIFLDTFWWFFLQKFQANQPVQDSLFTRISDHYVEFLNDCAMAAVDVKCVETFLRRYPNCTCQAVYSAFIHGYPASWKRFDGEFRTDLCNTVYMWQVGTKPISQCWLKWNYDIIEPDNKLKHMTSTEDSTSPKSPRKDFMFDKLIQEEREKANLIPSQKDVSRQASFRKTFSNISTGDRSVKFPDDGSNTKLLAPQILVHDTDSKTSAISVLIEPETQPPPTEYATTTNAQTKLSRRCRKTTGWTPTPGSRDTSVQSHPVGQGIVFTHVVFDTCGHSPLVRHYLERKGLLKSSGYSMLVKRTEVDKLPPIETQTYKDLLHESNVTSKAAHTTFNQKYSEQVQASNRFEHQFQKERTKHNNNVSKILSKPRAVRKLSNALLLQVMGEGRRITQISNTIEETLEQLKSTL